MNLSVNVFLQTDSGHRCKVAVLFCGRLRIGSTELVKDYILQKHSRNQYGVLRFPRNLSRPDFTSKCWKLENQNYQRWNLQICSFLKLLSRV